MKIDVAIPRTKIDYFTYNSRTAVQIGDLVLVPLRNKLKHGIVVAINSQRQVPGIKETKDTVEKGFLPPTMVQLNKWIAEYYLTTLGEVLRLTIPAHSIARYEEGEHVSAAPSIARMPIPTYSQNYAIQRIMQALEKQAYKTFLLYGVTGSGKTEVYLRCIEEVIRRGGRALVLVPEISMTPLLFKRFQERFQNDVVTIHSSLTHKERKQLWYAIRAGRYRIVIGPRSTVFIPIPDLRMIVVDEEHDQSYKEHERAPHYNARDVAVMRGMLEKFVVVLGSATPQIESYHNAGIGKYELLTLKERIDRKSLPDITIIDLKKEHRKYITAELESHIEKALNNDEQVILFLNRRGFAPNLLCPYCGYVARCPYCALPMVYHKAEKAEGALLSCHICSYTTGVIGVCPKCHRRTLLYRGAGTQRIEELVTSIAQRSAERRNVLRLDRDIVRKRGQAEQVFNVFEQKKAHILLGTQLVTKGFDFPDVTLVGIINADVILNLPDFRSSERTFQIITQVAGRSGRGKKPGTVLMQTHHPEQYSILFGQLQNYPKFYAQEMQVRKELQFPPFTRLIVLRLKGEQEKAVWKEAEKLAAILKRTAALTVYGPNRSFYYKIRKQYHVFILIKIPRYVSQGRLKFLSVYRPQTATLDIDVDPLETF